MRGYGQRFKKVVPIVKNVRDTFDCDGVNHPRVFRIHVKNPQLKISYMYKAYMIRKKTKIDMCPDSG